MDSRTEKKIEKELDRADKEHDKAVVLEAKGKVSSAEKHENKALAHESKAATLAGHEGGHYQGLNYPMTGATAHPQYGYNRLPRDKKAERLEAKAVSWESRGNATKAQKNREKALKHRQRMQPGYVPIQHPQPYYVDKANRLDQRSLKYQEMGLTSQSNRCRQRALRTRNKHGVTAPAVVSAAGLIGTSGVSNTTYKGLNYPHTGATAHPTGGHQRLTAAQKAQRFEQKAAEYERRGDVTKAQKNKEKANRYRQMGVAGYQKPTRAQEYYTTRAANFDQKALRSRQMGRNDRALRYQQKAQRIRSKHNAPVTNAAFGTNMTGNTNLSSNNISVINNPAGFPAGTTMGPVQYVGTRYQGLNHPYAGAVAHPQYGYQRLPADKKAARFEAKAAEWERRGNLKKAQKNREKAQRHRARTQPGYVAPVRTQDYYVNRANHFDQRAVQYQQWGMVEQAQRYQGRSQRIRTKRNIPVAGLVGTTSTVVGNTSYPAGSQVGPMRHVGTTYSGLNYPYAGAATHPKYGYQRLAPNKKAERFEAKAAEWERRGNLKKAQKNREKALRYRARTQPGYVAPVRPADYYVTRANHYDQRALQYQQWGMTPQYQRAQGRAARVRAKHNVPVATYPQRPSYQYATTYHGLNFPYTNATAHPTYGYQRLAPNHKAERFEAKAAEWERRGYTKQALKNREKAARARARTQPGYVAPVRPQTYYVDRAGLFDQKATQYQQWGMQPQAIRYQQRAQRVRTKHNVPVVVVPVQQAVVVPVRTL